MITGKHEQDEEKNYYIQNEKLFLYNKDAFSGINRNLGTEKENVNELIDIVI